MRPLEGLIRGIIAEEGPIPVDRYMALCLGHPQHGYYVTRDPLGGEGDFITAPEVSQVFGELIAVWAVSQWQAMGEPSSFLLVELGPGRGTLMADVLRTLRRAAPACAAAARVHFVETSPVLRGRQRAAVGEGASWHGSLPEVPDGPVILLANEFFDAIPIRQFERRGGRWHERVVGVVEGALSLGLGPPVPGPAGHEGDIVEPSPAREEIARHIGARLSRHPGAALIIDYGHLATAPGDTLQAMRGHRFVPVTEEPGACDITSHVDFASLSKALREGGGVVHPALTQGDFLRAMGLEARFGQLIGRADPATGAILGRQMARLADGEQMGKLFKVLAATAPGLPAPYPFG